MKQQLNENQLVSVAVVYLIIKKLCTPFTEWDAYKLGIIDENGKVLRKRYTLRTREEKNAYTMFDTLMINIKRLLGKLPGGKSRLASYAAALWLISESKNYGHYLENADLFAKDFIKYLQNFKMTEDHQRMLSLVDLSEDMASGNIANVSGSGVSTDFPFKPKVKTKPEDLSKRFSEMYEEIVNISGPAVATDVPFKSKEKQSREKFKVFANIERRNISK